MNNSPCAKFTTSMMPKISVRPEATRAKIMPVTMPLTVWISSSSHGMLDRKSTALDPQILLDHGVVDVEFGRGAVVPHHAFFEDVDALACLERQRHVLLDQQDGDAVAMQHVDDLADLRHHARHQALGRLVKQ